METACGLIPYQVYAHNREMTRNCQLENTYFLKKTFEKFHIFPWTKVRLKGNVGYR